jgi:hypothetical protein
MPEAASIKSLALSVLARRPSQAPAVQVRPKPVIGAGHNMGQGTDPCGSPYCAGCYEVAPGVRVHPPKCGEDYRAWLERWEAKGKMQ